MSWIITKDQVNPPGDAAITYGITNAGDDFNLLSIGTVDYEAEWGDGNVEISTLNTLQHTYTAAGDYSVVVYSDGVYRPYFVGVTADATQITSVAIGSGADLGTNLGSAWHGASNMTTFTCPFDVTSSVTSFGAAWFICTSLTSFPLLNTSSGTLFNRAWRGCTSLTSFPLLDVSNGTSFGESWLGCTSLTSFPELNTSSGTNFSLAWYGCSNLTSFPQLNTSSGTLFSFAWYNCSSLSDFPANMFDTTGTLISTAFTKLGPTAPLPLNQSRTSLSH